MITIAGTMVTNERPANSTSYGFVTMVGLKVLAIYKLSVLYPPFSSRTRG
jgi:hypothetical protein